MMGAESHFDFVLGAGRESSMEQDYDRIAKMKLKGCAYCVNGEYDPILIACLCKLDNKDRTPLACCEKFEDTDKNILDRRN